MENLELNAVSRDTAVKAKSIRQGSRIPAVVYGKGEDNIFVDFDYQEFRKLYKEAGHNTLINLNVDGAKPVEVLVHDVDYDPVSGNFIHIDFKRITRGVEITTEVAVVFEGVSEAVKTLGGMLITNKEYIDVKCLPRNLIHEVKADISLLKDFSSKITVADLDIPETVTVLNAPDEVVATAAAPRAAIEADEEEGTETVETEEAGEAAEADKE